jgi:hypothetical protein
MQQTNSDPNLILTALWTMLDSIVDEENEKVFPVVSISNRPAVGTHDDFIVIDINGMVLDRNMDSGHAHNARCVVLVQLFARDLDAKGTLNMGKLTTMYKALIGALPYNSAPYTFSKKNQVGRRDTLGFHATLVNLDCLIY